MRNSPCDVAFIFRTVERDVRNRIFSGLALAVQHLLRNVSVLQLPSGAADLRDALAVAHSVDAGFAEVHHIAGQGACKSFKFTLHEK